MENKNLQDLLKKVISDNQNATDKNITSLDENSSLLLKGGTLDSSGCSKVKIENL